MTNPWEAAQAQFGGGQQAQPNPQGGTYVGSPQSQQQGLSAGYAPAPVASQQSRLFTEQGAPSLFNKTHFLGTVREGIITAAPRLVQDRDFNSKQPKYFSKSKVGVPIPAITTDAIDGPTGEKNDPVMAEHFTLQTDYRMDAGECAAVGRPASFAQEDDGTRVEVIGGKYDLPAFKKAMKDFVAAGGRLTCPDDFIGIKITSKRSGQVPAGANKAWVREFTLSRP